MTRSSLSYRGLFVLAIVACCTLPGVANATYARPDIIEVPVERLSANLEQIAREDPKNVSVRFNLARLYAMAYALKTDTAKVNKGREEQGAWFGYEPAFVPFKAKPTDDAEKQQIAEKHLSKAIALYEEVAKLSPEHLAARLGHAWCVEQSGKKKQAIAEYRKVIAMGWEKEGKFEHGRLGGHYITSEAASYLIPLLDPEKDKNEIETLQQRTKRLKSLPRAITPIVVPLRNGLSPQDLIDPQARVAFDADGTGLSRRWTWITPNGAWLVTDPRSRGRITSGLQMFGAVAFCLFWDHGYLALAALDDDRDGTLRGRELAGLALWHDANSNGRSDPGEVRPLADCGIVALSCRWKSDASRPDVIAFSPSGVVFRDGTARPTYDLLLRAMPHGK